MRPSILFHNSPDPMDWPITSRVRYIEFRPNALIIEHDKSNQWPPVQFQTALQEATIWFFLNISGHWHGAGLERLRPNQGTRNNPKPENVPSTYYANLWYDRNRWGEMTGYQPAPGEIVGMMVTSGEMRQLMDPGPRERTDLVFFPWPTDAGGVPAFTSQEADDPPADPPIDPSPVITSTDVERILSAIAECQRQTLAGIERQTAAIEKASTLLGGYGPALQQLLKLLGRKA